MPNTRVAAVLAFALLLACSEPTTPTDAADIILPSEFISAPYTDTLSGLTTDVCFITAQFVGSVTWSDRNISFITKVRRTDGGFITAIFGPLHYPESSFHDGIRFPSGANGYDVDVGGTYSGRDGQIHDIVKHSRCVVKAAA